MSSEYNGSRGPERDGGGPSYRNQPGTGSLNGANGWGNGNVAVRSAYGTGGLRAPESNEPPGLASLDELMEAVRQELDQITRETDEIKLLIRSTNTELDRAKARQTQTAARVREMEARLETFARQEIRTTYLASGEADMRVFMMQEQRDRVQDKMKAHERYQRSLQQTLNTLLHLQSARQQRGEVDPSIAHVARIVQTQEQLRKRIAQQLHDGPAQALANVVLSAEICEQTIDHDIGRTRSELKSLKESVGATLRETRKFIFDLRPMTLDDLGLFPTLKRYTQDLMNKTGIQVMFTPYGAEQRLPPPVEISLFRIAQEALSNVVNHANAHHASVSLHVHEQGVTMTIEDDGQGFNVEQVMSEAQIRPTVGLTSMFERAEMLKTRLKIESMPGRGTRVEVTVLRQGTDGLPML
ncbi:MAG TPA: histidine kinase [Ktedonobacterales bacterium]|nr:histidine kinase [Ktedonobacterales bacterium]